MKIGAMNHPARNPLEEIDWFGRQGFDFVDFTLEPSAALPGQIDPKAIRAALDRHDLGAVAQGGDGNLPIQAATAHNLTNERWHGVLLSPDWLPERQIALVVLPMLTS